MTGQNLAPICLFVYARREETERTLDALRGNHYANESDLIVFSDGPKVGKEADVSAVRDLIRSLDGFRSITIHESPTNKGLAASVIFGVTKVLETYEKVIVLEDDIMVSKSFLTYMNQALDYYFDNINVFQISGFMFPISPKGLPDTFFYAANSCWGWGTWNRAWKHLDVDVHSLIRKIEKLPNGWSRINAMQNREFEKQLRNNASGAISTWAVKWHASIILNEGTVVHPKVSLVSNIGFSGNGENCGKGPTVGDASFEGNLDVSMASFQDNAIALKRIKHYCFWRFSILGKSYKRLVSLFI